MPDPKPHHFEIPFPEDTEALLALDDLYVGLYCLLQLHNPDPDYMGIEDPTVLTEIIADSINRIPAPHQALFHQHAEEIQQMIENGDYPQAQDMINSGAENVSNLISDGRPAPSRIQRIPDGSGSISS